MFVSFPFSVCFGKQGILPFYGSGHSSFAWMIRSHPNVKAIFESIYGTSDLISSLDGIALWTPQVCFLSNCFSTVTFHNPFLSNRALLLLELGIIL
jgi:hypothetical protein